MKYHRILGEGKPDVAGKLKERLAQEPTEIGGRVIENITAWMA